MDLIRNDIQFFLKSPLERAAALLTTNCKQKIIACFFSLRTIGGYYGINYFFAFCQKYLNDTAALVAEINAGRYLCTNAINLRAFWNLLVTPGTSRNDLVRINMVMSFFHVGFSLIRITQKYCFSSLRLYFLHILYMVISFHRRVPSAVAVILARKHKDKMGIELAMEALDFESCWR